MFGRVDISHKGYVYSTEIIAKTEVIKSNLKASTWHELETKGKFDKNQKLTFISDDMLILGGDVGSETHYVRAIDTRGRKLSKSAFPFSNTLEGFQRARDWAEKIAAANDKNQVVLGLEPTDHYWFCLATWMISNGISVVQVNPYAVKQTKELEDNSQLKDDTKDPIPITKYECFPKWIWLTCPSLVQSERILFRAIYLLYKQFSFLCSEYGSFLKILYKNCEPN